MTLLFFEWAAIGLVLTVLYLRSVGGLREVFAGGGDAEEDGVSVGGFRRGVAIAVLLAHLGLSVAALWALWSREGCIEPGCDESSERSTALMLWAAAEGLTLVPVIGSAAALLLVVGRNRWVLTAGVGLGLLAASLLVNGTILARYV